MALIFNRVRPSGEYVMIRYGDVYVSFTFMLYGIGVNPGPYTRSGYGNGSAFMWQQKVKINQVIERWIGGRVGTLGTADNRFYDSSIDDKLGGTKQMLGS